MFAVDDGLWAGYFNAADVLFLIATILFVIQAVLVLASRPDPTKGALLPLSLAAVACGLMLW